MASERDMPGRPLVSVVIIFLNAEAFLREAIESVLAQSYPHWELLLVDDGSDDRSPEIAGAFADLDPGRVRYLHHPGRENRGMSASRNVGIREASGSLVAFLDADDVWLPLKLERQVGMMVSHQSAAMVYGKSEYWYSWTGEQSDTRSDRVQDHWIDGDALVHPPALLTAFLSGRAALPPPCSVMVRRAAANDIGGFEESFRGLYEDQAFYAKLCLEHPVFVSDECLERYRQHPASICAASDVPELEEAGRRYLSWLKGHVESRGGRNTELWQALNRQIWLARRLDVGSSRIEATIRRAKKWLLKIEERVLPAPIRRRLWT